MHNHTHTWSCCSPCAPPCIPHPSFFLSRWLAASPHPFSPHQLKRLFEVQSALTDAAVASRRDLLSLALPAALLVKARNAWVAQQRGGPLGDFKADVYTTLKELGMSASLSVPTSCGMHVLDAVVRLPNAAWAGGGRGAGGGGVGGARATVRTPLALVLDGPEAFAANAPGSALGETAARWRALQARGLRVGAWACVRACGC